MEKKFLPLPPLRKSPQESSIHVQELLSDSIIEAEGENSSSSTSVLESVTTNNHCISTAASSVLGSATVDGNFNITFGNFHFEIIPIKPLKSVKPRIEGCIIKIGEISCFWNKFTMEEHHDYASSFSFPTSELKDELTNFPNVSNSSVTINLESEFVAFESVNKSNDFITNLDFVLIQMCYFIHCINNAVLAVQTVFDPDGRGNSISPFAAFKICGDC
ncbi:unnamed protein product [Trifolium pratense]|uniref:Uncharacterized protein n=1 Tax=Trifolium pratense TaxID=57577 RepID=A0ACB0JYS7_TRIPR|nr:unnamed protein product [Trifolium pratense]